MNNKSETTRPTVGSPVQHIFTVMAGLFLGVALVKFGNPIIFEQKILPPTNFDTFRFEPWPFRWAYLGFAPVVVLALLAWWKSDRPRLEVPKWLLLMPLVWLGWQFVSATKTVSEPLTVATLKHFVVCVAWFYIGLFVWSRVPRPSLLFIGLVIGFILVLKQGFYQHLTLETQRQYFLSIDWNNPPPEVQERLTAEELERFRSPEFIQKKLLSSRISGTLFYPNSLAAVILLLLPCVLVVVWRWMQPLRPLVRWAAIAVITLSALCCLYWSGSKSGWLLMLLLVVLSGFQLSIPRKVKVAMIAGVVLAGVVGFAIKYAAFFEKGATSVVARGAYWKAAVQIFVSNPILGTGPGTFSVEHAKVKDPSAEMARLCHNDFLEQASDSGLVGFLSFAVLFIGGMAWLYRKSVKKQPFLIFWCALAIVLLHGMVEFNLYIPAIAWLTFLMMGYLVGLQKTGGQERWS